MDRQVQTLLLYRWLLEMVQNSSFCLNNTQITCSALITYNYLHYTELMFTLIKRPLFSKRYLETFISMAGKKNEDGSQCLSDEIILKGNKKPFEGQDILASFLHLLIVFLYPQNHTVYYFLMYLCYRILS